MNLFYDAVYKCKAIVKEFAGFLAKTATTIGRPLATALASLGAAFLTFGKDIVAV